MIEGGGGLGFAHEAPDAVFAPDQLGREDLERDVAFERLVLSEIDLAHAACAKWPDDPVVGNLILGLERPLRGHGRR
jgi:hypothetical protein